MHGDFALMLTKTWYFKSNIHNTFCSAWMIIACFSVWLTKFLQHSPSSRCVLYFRYCTKLQAPSPISYSSISKASRFSSNVPWPNDLECISQKCCSQRKSITILLLKRENSGRTKPKALLLRPWCFSCVTLRHYDWVLVISSSSSSFIKSVFILGCCSFPLPWEWQHQTTSKGTNLFVR